MLVRRETPRPWLVLLVVALAVPLALLQLPESLVFLTLLLTVTSVVFAVQAGHVVVAAAAGIAGLFALLGPLICHWRPLRTWLTMIVVALLELLVILVMSPP